MTLIRCRGATKLKKGCPAIRPNPMTFSIKGVCDLGSHYYYLISIFYSMRNALKSTYSNVEIQKKIPLENPRTSCLKVSEGEEATFYAVREGMVPRKFEHLPA